MEISFSIQMCLEGRNRVQICLDKCCVEFEIQISMEFTHSIQMCLDDQKMIQICLGTRPKSKMIQICLEIVQPRKMIQICLENWYARIAAAHAKALEPNKNAPDR